MDFIQIMLNLFCKELLITFRNLSLINIIDQLFSILMQHKTSLVINVIFFVILCFQNIPSFLKTNYSYIHCNATKIKFTYCSKLFSASRSSISLQVRINPHVQPETSVSPASFGAYKEMGQIQQPPLPSTLPPTVATADATLGQQTSPAAVSNTILSYSPARAAARFVVLELLSIHFNICLQIPYPSIC